MADIKTPERVEELPIMLIKNVVTLATSGFGLVVALAWNSAIQKFVQDVINPYLGPNGGLLSLFVYALIVTALAVLISMQLVIIQRRMEQLQDKVAQRRNRNKKDKIEERNAARHKQRAAQKK